MKKKWIGVAVIIISIAIIGLLVFLLIGENDNQTDNNSNSGYVKAFDLNCDTNIVVPIGSQFTLADDCIIIKPSNMKDIVEIEIDPLYSATSRGLTLKNGVYTANEKGSYNIIFKVPYSSTEKLERRIKIVVDEDMSTPITNLNKRLFTNSQIVLDDCFNIDLTNYAVKYKINGEFIENGVLNTSQNGSYEVDIEINKGNIIYNYKEYILVRNIPEYHINFDGHEMNDDNCLELTYSKCDIGDTVSLNYTVYDKNNNINIDKQKLNIELSNSEVIGDCLELAPSLSFTLLAEGEVTINISYFYDESITCKIKIIVQS